MKISKLFHWLYGLIMLLPIFAIGTTCLISTFNMASKEESEIHYKYETNEVNSILDLKEGNLYKINLNFFWNTYNVDTELEIYDTKVILISNSTDVNTNKIAYYSTDYFDMYHDETKINLYNDNWGTPLIETEILSTIPSAVFNLSNTNLYLIYNNNITLHGDNLYYELFTISDYNEIDYVETHNVAAQDVFYNSVDKVTTSSLFSWA